MLHEILLSLSGHPSPLLRNDFSDPKSQAVLSPPERDLLRTVAHLGDLHCKLIARTAEISTSHPSVICRAVSTAIKSTHLAAFQRKILEVEDGILRKDAALVGAYNIVPLTAVIGEFSGWTRRLEWLWEITQFMHSDKKAPPCRAANLIDRLRGELQTGYADVGETALSLVKVAEAAWVKQISAWVLYGRIPTLGEDDFFIREDKNDEQVSVFNRCKLSPCISLTCVIQGYSIDYNLLPSFVTHFTANSMLFIGASLNHIRSRNTVDTSASDLRNLSIPLQELSSLTFPLSSPMLSKAITSIRLHLSRTVLQKLLPLSRVLETLQLLREFFLLGRGEFAMALTQQADEKIRSRWRRADNLAYEKRDGFGTIVIKEGEVTAALNRTWAALGAMQGEHAEEDEDLELARDLLRLELVKPKTSTPKKARMEVGRQVADSIVTTPFHNLLFSVPVVLTMQVPPPLDLFLSNSDLETYTAINSYLLAIRRAHLRLTDLWKVTSLRRQHPAPPRPPYSLTRGGATKTRTLRERHAARSLVMRGPWSTSSAAIFFLAETEAYLQVEVVEGLWDHFHTWVLGKPDTTQRHRPATPSNTAPSTIDGGAGDGHLRGNDDQQQQHDPQTLSAAHRRYLRALTRRLLLARPSPSPLSSSFSSTTAAPTITTTTTPFVDALHALLVHVDHLVALVRRLDGIWRSADLEADEGVVDAFSNLEAEERDVRASLRDVEGRLKRAVGAAVDALRALSVDSAFLAQLEGEGDDDDDGDDGGGAEGDEDENTRYRPRRIGGVDRLLMKLDFGVWFDGVDGANDRDGGFVDDGF